jgi:ABC-type dipeptide/oligopeptide/nickel transport system permease component
VSALASIQPRVPVLDGHPWLAFLGRRLTRFLVSVAILVTACFAMVHALPGDPVRDALGLKTPANVVAAERHKLGLDASLWHQYWHYVHNLFTLNLGTSLVSGTSVNSIMSQHLPATIVLALIAFAVALIVSIPVGMVIGVLTREHRGRRTHLGFGSMTGVLLSVPDYVLSVLLVYIFAVSWHVFPVAGRSGADSYVLPVIALSAGPIAYLARIVRAETQRVLAEEYMLTARAKRLPARLIYLRHALPNILTATLTVSGLILSSLLAGTVLVETVFAWPGIGNELVQSVLATDFPVVQAAALFFGSAVLLINLAVDIAIAVVDPRSTIRES